MACENPKKLIQAIDNKVQQYTDSGARKIKAWDTWPCDECEEPSAWNSTTTYWPPDRVIHNDIKYRCILSHTNQEPPNPTYWEIYAKPVLWEECATPFYIYVTFTGIIACDGMPAPPNGTKFKLWQIAAPLSCEWYNPDDGSGWYVTFVAYESDAPGGSRLDLVRVASGKHYFLEWKEADCETLFTNNLANCAEPEFYEGKDGQGEITWDTVSNP